MSFSAIDSTLLGPLFATEDMRDVFSDRTRLGAMIEVEAALAEALALAGLGPAELAATIREIAPDELDIAALGADTAISGVPVIPFVKAMQKRLPKALESAFHKGATTQDIADTALVLQARQAMRVALPELIAILDGLASLAERHARTPCVGRTYGQHAAPVSFGFKVGVWLEGIAEVAADWPLVFERIGTLSLAGPVGTGAGYGTRYAEVAEAMASSLGLTTTTIAWHTRRARMVQLGTWLASLIGALSKMASDVAHLASTEVGEVAEPHIPGRGGSSSMPHKRNPVAATVILAAAAAAKGHVVTLLDAMVAAHERPAGAWHAEWHALPQLFGLLSGALLEARRLAEGLEVDTARMRANLELTRGLIYADKAAALLAKTLGRAAAHERVEQAAQRVRDGGGDLFAALSADSAVTSALETAELAPAFDISPAVDAAAAAAGRAADAARRTIAILNSCPT